VHKNAQKAAIIFIKIEKKGKEIGDRIDNSATIGYNMDYFKGNAAQRPSIRCAVRFFVR
jgi:hypothetical protein